MAFESARSVPFELAPKPEPEEGFVDEVYRDDVDPSSHEVLVSSQNVVFELAPEPEEGFVDEGSCDDVDPSTCRIRRSRLSLQRKGMSYRRLFDTMSATEIMDSLGRGGASRMFARGKATESDQLSSVGKFLSRGSTLDKATALTASAVASDRNVRKSSGKPGAMADLLGASHEHPVQEMQFYNIGGAKVYYYYGLDTVRSPEHVMAAGPHIRDTAVGVLMLDQYKIQERPGDPSNPLTFWPYQTFFSIPQGITFEKCKIVASSGANALRDYPLETSAICQALLALAEVASRSGYKRLMIAGDCGYYALSAEAFAKNLSCWGTQSWVPHPDGAFASFRVPYFKSPSLDLDIILCLGTTQMISSPKPEMNLSSQLGGDTSVVYLTADLRSWYNNQALDTVSEEYAPLLRLSWYAQQLDFKLEEEEISTLDMVVQVNSSLLEGVAIQNSDAELLDVVENLLELNAGSTASVVGLFLGHMASQMKDSGESPAERAWASATDLTTLVEDMAHGKDGALHPENIIVEKVSPVLEYLQPILLRIAGQIGGKKMESLTEEEEFRLLAVLIGNPMPKGRPPPDTYKVFKRAMAIRIQMTFCALLSVRNLRPEISGLPVGKMFVEFYANFNAKLNKNVLSKVNGSHAIDGRKFILFDCRFVPCFGFNVSKSLTVWTARQNYFWMGTILLRFSEIMQRNGWMGAATYHMECTELFSFTPFFHEMGLPVVDGVNALLIASRSTDAPMRFVNFKQKNNHPPTPSALVADTSGESALGVAYYRDVKLALRTPTYDSVFYNISPSQSEVKLMEADKERWKDIKFAQPLFRNLKLKWGFESYVDSKPSESIYPSSSALDIPYYVGQQGLSDQISVSEDAFVQYAPLKSQCMFTEDANFHSFFGGDLYYDRNAGNERRTVLVRSGMIEY